MKEVQIHMSTVATMAQKIPAEATVSISHEPGSAAAITIAVMVEKLGLR
jgi:phosphopantetheinyl transferase (holo-ACP synthase)